MNVHTIRTGRTDLPFFSFPFLLPLFCSLLSFLLASCVADPEVPEQPPVGGVADGVIVVNQGLWRGDNASLTLYSPGTDRATQNWFARQNPGSRLGDSGNDIVIRKRRAYIAVSESATIEVIDLPEGTSAGRIRFPAGTFPQHLIILNDSTGWASNLEDDSIIEFNPATFETGRRVPVGPAPEGIAAAAGRIFVANSGLGALRRNEPGAGTISVLGIGPENGERRIEVGGDLRDLRYFPQNGMLYAFAGAPLPDTAGSGLAEIDPATLEITRRWSFPGAWDVGFDQGAQQAYIIAQGGIFRIDLAETDPVPELFLPQSLSTLNEEVPHGIGISPYTGEIFVAVARGYYSAPGRTDRYDREGNLLGSFQTGLNPTAFGFYR